MIEMQERTNKRAYRAPVGAEDHTEIESQLRQEARLMHAGQFVWALYDAKTKSLHGASHRLVWNGGNTYLI